MGFQNSIFRFISVFEKKCKKKLHHRQIAEGRGNVPVTEICVTGDKHPTLSCYKKSCFVSQSCFWIPSSRFTRTWDSKGEE